jgi:hypothetical protein
MDSQDEAEVFETGSNSNANEEEDCPSDSSSRSDINTSHLEPPDSRKFKTPLDTHGQDYSDSLRRRRRSKFTNFPDRKEYSAFR